MYDILQLNDMLVPELLDIAEQLNIPNAKKSDKQDLIYKILDKQATAGDSKQNGIEKPKRKRIIKASTANTTEEAEVMTEAKETPEQTEEKEVKQKKKSARKSKEKEPEPQEEKTASAKEEITDLDI